MTHSATFSRIVDEALGWVPPPRKQVNISRRSSPSQIRRILRMWANGEEVIDIAEVLNIDYKLVVRHTKGVER